MTGIHDNDTHDTHDREQLPEGLDDAGGFVLNGYLYTGAMAKAMYLLTRPEGIRYKDLCKALGWKRCRTQVKKDALRADHVIAYEGEGGHKVMRVVPRGNIKRGRPSVSRGVLEQIATEHGLPPDTFSPEAEDALRVWFHIRAKQTAQVKEGTTASGLTLQEVLAEAVAPWCAPPKTVDAEEVRQRAQANRAALPRVTDIGIGAGIDADGVYRKVRLRGLEQRRGQLAVERAEKLSVAMRDFVKAAAAAGASADDLRAALDSGGLTAKKLAERSRSFDAIAGDVVLALSDARRPLSKDANEEGRVG